MTNKIFITVGTSITDNTKLGKFPGGFGSDAFSENWDNFTKSNFENKKSVWLTKINADATNKGISQLSAEISSLLKIAESKPNDTFEVYLLATDTLESAVCAWAIQAWFEARNDARFNVHFNLETAIHTSIDPADCDFIIASSYDLSLFCAMHEVAILKKIPFVATQHTDTQYEDAYGGRWNAKFGGSEYRNSRGGVW